VNKLLSVAVVSAVVALVGCDRGNVMTTCERVCVADERCDLPTKRCVPNERPVILVESPIAESLINTADLTLRGTIVDDSGLTVQRAEASLDDGATWTPIGVGDLNRFEARLGVPRVDGARTSLQVRAFDAEGNEALVLVPVVLDRVGPSCSFQQPMANAVLSGSEATVRVQVQDGSLRLGSRASLVLDPTTTLEANVIEGVALFTVTLPSLDGAAREWTFEGTDEAGNTCATRISVRVDTVGPVAVLISPTPGQRVTRDTSGVVPVRFSVTDGTGIQVAEVLAPPSTLWQPATLTNGVATFDWQVPANEEGASRTLSVRAKDLQGTLGAEVSATVVLDTVPPVCTLLSPMPAQVLNAASGPIFQVRWQVQDGSTALGGGEVSLDDGTSWLPVTIDMTGLAAYPWALGSTRNGETVALRVRATDAAGNRCPEQRVQVTVDVVPPTVTVTTPMRNAAVSTPTLTFTGQASDGSAAVNSMTLDFGDAVGARPVGVLGTQWSVTVPTVATEDFVTHAAQVRAVDAAGNATTVTHPVRVDRVAPVPTIVAPMEGQRFNAQQVTAGAVTLTGQALDGDPFVALEVQSSPGVWTALAGQTWAVQTLSSDDDVEYQEALRARDTAGNVASVTRRFRVDRVAPTVVLTSPASGARNTTTDFAMQFSEAMRLVGTAIPFTFTPAQPVSATVALSGGDRVVTVSGLNGDQPYSVVLNASRLTDVSGNPPVVASAVSFTTAPRGPLPNTVLLSANASQRVELVRTSQDEDGVIALAVRVINPTSSVRTWLLGWVDPKTGLFTQQATVPAGDTGALISNVIDFSSVPPRRTATAVLGVAGSSHVWTLGVPGVRTFSALTVGVPAAGELPGTAEVTLGTTALGFTWTRPPNAAVEVPLFTPIVGTAAHSAGNVLVFGWEPSCSSPPCFSSVLERTRTCDCPADGGTCACAWGPERALGAIVRDTTGPRTLGDLFRTVQVVRTAQQSWWASDNWVGGDVETVIGACTGLNGFIVPLTGPVAMARSGNNGLLFASAGNHALGARVRVLRLEACPVTGNEPFKDFIVTDGATQPGANPSSKRNVSMAPVAGPTIGLLYVTSSGDLKYVE
jgi:hypothetical protein